MDRASDEMQYERAAEMRDQIKALRQVQAQQVIEKGRGIIDVIAASLERVRHAFIFSILGKAEY